MVTCTDVCVVWRYIKMLMIWRTCTCNTFFFFLSSAWNPWGKMVTSTVGPATESRGGKPCRPLALRASQTTNHAAPHYIMSEVRHMATEGTGRLEQSGGLFDNWGECKTQHMDNTYMTDVEFFEHSPYSCYNQTCVSERRRCTDGRFSFFQVPQQQKPHHGLINQGATCYLNSVLQVLFMTTEIHHRFETTVF